jgi:formylglycine-generating enzyme required for sulfatase activity
MATRSGSSSTTAWCLASRPGSIAAISRAAAPSSWSAITCAARNPPPPSLLSRPELRELAPHADAIAALDTEWRRADHSPAAERAWTPGALVARSRQVQRRVTLAAIGLVLTVIAGIGAAVFERWRSANDRKAEIARRDRDLGLIAFEFAPFDWNVDKLEPIDVPITDLPNLRWAIHTVKLDPDTDVEDPGDPYPAERFRLLSSELLSGGTRLDTAEASGGPAFLVISGRNRAGEPDCGPSIIPIRALPGYPQRKLGPQRHRIPVPSCQATYADMIEIPAGEFIYGGPGEPPSTASTTLEERRLLQAFQIDRNEATNAFVSQLARQSLAPGLARQFHAVAPELEFSHRPDAPATNLSYTTAIALCRIAGKELQLDEQWMKAMRGGLTIDGVINPLPRRNFPWGTSTLPPPCNIARAGASPARVLDERPHGRRQSLRRPQPRLQRPRVGASRRPRRARRSDDARRNLGLYDRRVTLGLPHLREPTRCSHAGLRHGLSMHRPHNRHSRRKSLNSATRPALT